MKNQSFSPAVLNAALSLESAEFQQSELPQVGSHRFVALSFAFRCIGTDQIAEDLNANSLREYLSNNNVCFREVTTPEDLIRKRSQTIIVESITLYM